MGRRCIIPSSRNPIKLLLTSKATTTTTTTTKSKKDSDKNRNYANNNNNIAYRRITVLFLLFFLVTLETMMSTIQPSLQQAIRRSSITKTDASSDSEINNNNKQKKSTGTLQPRRKEIVLIIHYHKTGNAFVKELVSLLIETKTTNERSMMTNNNNNTTTNSHHHRSGLGLKRRHDKTTGCPLWKTTNTTTTTTTTTEEEEDIIMIKPGTILHSVTAPDFFCPVQSALSSLLQQQQQQVSFKIVHLVRDPIDMAISNYLYHSQIPTPESWVLRPTFDPCQYDDDHFFQYILQQLAEQQQQEEEEGVSKKELIQVHDMCRDLFQSPSSNQQQQKSYYRTLLELSNNYDGLRLATAQFLISNNVESGGDLLRMPNNIIRLAKWQKQEQRNNGNNNVVLLTVSMDQILADMNTKVFEIANFILQDNNNNESQRKTMEEVSKRIADQMLQNYNIRKIQTASFRNSTTITISHKTTTMKKQQKKKQDKRNRRRRHRDKLHISQDLVNQTERQLWKEQLEKDDILGPLLLKLRSIVNNALQQ
eukprot:scaffold913_cov71-Cylindrotheca_fusiformis.AAC.4